MRCGQVKELLSAYLDAELALEEREQVALHLQYCRGCGEILTDFRRFDLLLTHLPRVSPEHKRNVTSRPFKKKRAIARFVDPFQDKHEKYGRPGLTPCTHKDETQRPITSE